MKSNYSKIIRWILLALMVISLGVVLWAVIYGFDKNNAIAVDVIFYWTYVMLGIAAVSIVFIGGAIAVKNDRKFLWKLLASIAGTAVLIGVVYLLSPGTPAAGVLEQPSAQTLKFTDTILNLTYLFGAAAILSIVVGEIVAGVHNKKLAK